MLTLPLIPGDQPLLRLVQTNLQTSLADTPVVLIQGPRQCGKTTLARAVAEPRGYGYVSFDDDNLVRAARADPLGFVTDLPPKMVLDEVQRVPEIFTSLKLVVDRDRQPGRFLLTGSADVLLLPKLAESLAGRIEVLRLHPLAQVELRKQKACFLAQLFSADFNLASFQRMGVNLAELVVAGGFPPALTRQSSRRRAWYQAYAQTLIQRDVRDLARIAALDVMPRLLELAAGQTAHLFNVSELASPFGLSRPTVRDYLTLLERVFLVDILPPWHVRHINRLVKKPKLHLGDTGLAAALLRLDGASLHANRALLGQLLETFVFQELRRQASASPEAVAFYHFRNRDDHEVDLVLERGAVLAGVEVKASGTVRNEDFRGLRKLQDIAGERFVCGVVLYDGEASLRFGPRLFALPVQTLWADKSEAGFAWHGA
jgi:predicted AAA+ superfamily ATPase